MRTNCVIKEVNPYVLTQSHFLRLNEISQDIWAHGIYELVQCNHCKKMMSKKDIFGHLEKEVYDETVKKIMDILEIDKINCIECNGETRFIYGDENVENIKERLLLSDDSYIMTCENQSGEIVGFADAYYDDFGKIFNREFGYHYSDIGCNEVKKRVDEILGYNCEKIIVFSSIGFLEKYKNPFYLFDILKNFFHNMSDELLNKPGIMELDRKNPMYKIFTLGGGKSLGITDDEVLKHKITNKSKEYESDLVIFDSPVKTLREVFVGGAKDFLRKFRN